jgi:hypothetical protein
VEGFGHEFEALLATAKRMVAAERADREALKTFYATRRNQR